MAPFISAFQELGHALAFIHDVVDKDVVGVLQETWLDGHFAALRDCLRRHERCGGGKHVQQQSWAFGAAAGGGGQVWSSSGTYCGEQRQQQLQLLLLRQGCFLTPITTQTGEI